MTDEPLAVVERHLRRIASEAAAAGRDLAQLRALIDRYDDVHPSTAELGDARVVPCEAGGRPAEWLLAPGAVGDRRLLYLHGGSWMFGSLAGYRAHAARLSAATGCAVLSLDYRLAPENPWPAGLDDADAAFDWMRANGPHDRSTAALTVIAGDSAGGNLALALLLRRRDHARALPSAAVAFSPATDLTWSSATIETRADVDPILRPDRLPAATRAYLQGAAEPSHPHVSPLHGDLTGLPPLLLQTGEAEILLDDTRRLAERAEAAGVEVVLDLWPRMPHVFQVFAPYLPEASAAMTRAGDFVRRRR